MSWAVAWITPWFLAWFVGDPQVVLLPEFTVSVPNPVPTDVSVYLSIANRCVNPDGYPRVGVLAGMWERDGFVYSLPGPIISGNKGDRFFINVHNNLTDYTMLTGTTVHWHGIHQNHSSQMDGAAYVTQCPISPGSSFLYNFTANDQVGTFWYHSHYGVQYCDGLRGALIIRNPQDPFKDLYDFDDDSTVITLMDWYHYPSPETPRQIWPDSTLINGIGCYPGLICKDPSVITVKPKKRYRFRLLNMACKPFYDFSIADHTLTVIEVDGEYVEPYLIDSIRIHAAQRYSFIVNADQPVDNYWIDAKPNPRYMMNATYQAVLRYEGAPETPPKETMPMKPLKESQLRSLEAPPTALLKENADLRLNVVMGKNESGNYNFMINGVQYTSPSVPVLLQIMRGALSWEIEPVESVYLLPRNQVVEITFHFDATPGRPHPFHLHGHHFVVIKSSDTTMRNYDRPVMRDTVDTGFNSTLGEDNVTIRFITDNPGPWILHCHNEWHLETGMAIVFVEDYESIRANLPTGNLSCPYNNPHDDFPLPPPRTTAGPYTPVPTSTCTPDI